MVLGQPNLDVPPTPWGRDRGFHLERDPLGQQALVHVVVGCLVPRILGEHLVLWVAPVGIGVHAQSPGVTQGWLDVWLLVDVVPLADGWAGRGQPVVAMVAPVVPVGAHVRGSHPGHPGAGRGLWDTIC